MTERRTPGAPTNYELNLPRGGLRKEWFGGHRGSRGGGDCRYWKRKHKTWFRAFLHAWRHNRQWSDQEKVKPYPCRWSDDHPLSMQCYC